MLAWLSVWNEVHMAQLMPLPLTVSCFSKIQIGFTFVVQAHPGSPGQRTIKRVCMCGYMCARVFLFTLWWAFHSGFYCDTVYPAYCSLCQGPRERYWSSWKVLEKSRNILKVEWEPWYLYPGVLLCSVSWSVVLLLQDTERGKFASESYVGHLMSSPDGRTLLMSTDKSVAVCLLEKLPSVTFLHMLKLSCCIIFKDFILYLTVSFCKPSVGWMS